MMKNKKHRTLDYVQHMYQAINEILNYTKDMEYSSFLSNKILQKAICWNFNIIGEASRNIQKNDPEYLENNPDIPWIDAYEMRNHIVHGYWKVDPEIIWRTIDRELPEMSEQLALLLDRNEDNKPT